MKKWLVPDPAQAMFIRMIFIGRASNREEKKT
jgi:hypothetical protein